MDLGIRPAIWAGLRRLRHRGSDTEIIIRLVPFSVAEQPSSAVDGAHRTGHILERSPGSFELRYTLGTEPIKHGTVSKNRSWERRKIGASSGEFGVKNVRFPADSTIGWWRS